MKKRLQKKMVKKAFERFYLEYLDLELWRQKEIIIAEAEYDSDHGDDLELKISQIDDWYQEQFEMLDYEVERAGYIRYIGEMRSHAKADAKRLRPYLEQSMV